ncbi:hypothetical protein GS429_04815 [Natronorubrum sp. JWXQ-INN-674]|uniref:Uncharacterized protein n=2 Tax=Natronorubrum halalkaliphilum TaxID=2691917 RepID=A0A6B0VK68_9EURY|nr:hypothetical protein [Natronorubrum halalkaliphilum]
MVVPFFVALFPAVWYLNRNLTSERLPPYTEPTTELLLASIGAAIIGSVVFAMVVALITSRRGTNESGGLYRRRILRPSGPALRVFGLLIAVVFGWALTEFVGVGPLWVEIVFSILVLPLSIPFLLLAPLAIRFHWAVVLGLALCVLWLSLLATVVSDLLRRDIDVKT